MRREPFGAFWDFWGGLTPTWHVYSVPFRFFLFGTVQLRVGLTEPLCQLLGGLTRARHVHTIFFLSSFLS